MAIKKKKNTVRLWQGLRMKHQKRNYYFYYYIWTSSSFLGEGEHFSVCPIHFFFLFFIWHTRNNRERKRAMTIACTLSVKKKLEECGDLFVCQKKKRESWRHWWCCTFIMSLPLLYFSIALHAPTPSLDSLCVDSALSYIHCKFLERSYWSRSRVKI